ncbi:ATP-binding protein [Streptomyces sp. NPDC102402]|uniref:ATP-binding protein n=1 Tax=Streptomyces sp. NPDC102402 TaxID=3366169 RepID=UPI00381F13F4
MPSPAAGIDAPDRLDAFLDAVRWGAIATPGRGFRLSPAVHDDRPLRIAVTETLGERLPLLAPPAEDGESGRGLLIAEALADRWGVEVGPVPRKTVWAELDLHRDRRHRVAETHDPVGRDAVPHDA